MARSSSSDIRDLRAVACFLVSILLLTTILGVLAPTQQAFATEAQEKLDAAAEAGRKAAEGQKQVDALKDEIKTLDDQISVFSKQVAELEPQIDSASKQTEKLTHELRTLEEEAEVLRSKIAATSAEYSKQQELAGGRMSETYKQGDYFFFDLLLSANSFKDLLTRYEYVQRTIEANVLYARDLDATRRRLEDDKSRLDLIVAEAAAVQKEAADAEGNLRTMKASREEAMSNTSQIVDQKAALMEDTKASVEEQRALQSQLQSEAWAMLGALSEHVEWGSGEFSGMMTFPVGGDYNMSCPFNCGCGIHGGNHSGQDFGTFMGSPPALAAGGGRVVMAGWNGGYGNFVSIDHGDGVVTNYAHLNAILVSVGQTVSGGQPVGYIGSTGFSFGNHLHFEVVINGSFRNPMSYL
ncbi:MAG: peptidoglycan DD-metalloendopeptidase family protein [Coriobacteriia bacterium]|nr:peptidoglycan DD-metalloendopeptidase family protein [Coriobacteriia bacterium]